jgi:hypothetical protein
MRGRKLDYHPRTSWNEPDVHHFFREERSGFYSYMFIDDVTNHIMPYRTHSDSARFFL